MPTYEYLCDPEDGGCGEVFSITCLISEKTEKEPKSCPHCKKRKTFYQLFGYGAFHMPNTLGSWADKQASSMSEDEKSEIHSKHYEYRQSDGKPSWVQVGDRIVHRDTLEGN